LDEVDVLVLDASFPLKAIGSAVKPRGMIGPSLTSLNNADIMTPPASGLGGRSSSSDSGAGHTGGAPHRGPGAQFVFVTATLPVGVVDQLKADFGGADGSGLRVVSGPGLHRVSPLLSLEVVDCGAGAAAQASAAAAEAFGKKRGGGRGDEDDEDGGDEDYGTFGGGADGEAPFPHKASRRSSRPGAQMRRAAGGRPGRAGGRSFPGSGGGGEASSEADRDATRAASAAVKTSVLLRLLGQAEATTRTVRGRAAVPWCRSQSREAAKGEAMSQRVRARCFFVGIDILSLHDLRGVPLVLFLL
jgi:hypothetical protein